MKSKKKFFLWTGVGFIFFAVLILIVSLWDSFGGINSKFLMVELPGFQEINLKRPGLYAGIYQHRGAGPMPIEELSHMDVRLMSKGSYEEIPVLMNKAGQTFSRLGMTGMPVFNFAIQQPGVYTLSGMYFEGKPGPSVPILIFSQAAQDIRQTLMVGGVFFAGFLALGIWLLIKMKNTTA